MAKKQLSKIVGENIAKQRKKLNLTQEKLAEMINIDQAAISRMENGTVVPKFDRLEAIADALQCTVAELFYKNEKQLARHEKLNKGNINKLAVMLHGLSAEKTDVVLGTMSELVKLIKGKIH
jgi:transcriptional regulator with XRE-family HTH domain